MQIDFNDIVTFGLNRYTKPHLIIMADVLIKQWEGFSKYVNESSGTITLNLSPHAIGYLTVDHTIYTELKFGGLPVAIAVPLDKVIAIFDAVSPNDTLTVRNSLTQFDAKLIDEIQEAKLQVPEEKHPRQSKYVGDTFELGDNPFKLIKGGEYSRHSMLSLKRQNVVKLKLVKG